MAKKGFAGHKERKRGKKKSKQQEETHTAPIRDRDEKTQEAVREDQELQPVEGIEQPSWIIDTEGSAGDRKGKGKEALDHDLIAPFGYVDADVKAYFRDVHTKLQGAEYSLLPSTAEEGGGEGAADNGDAEHTLLLQAAIREMDGKELKLATDPDTSIVLEYMCNFMTEKQTRILMDRFSGSNLQLSRHRYGSHVLQTALVSLQRLISTETASSASNDGSSTSVLGILRTATQLLLDAISELKSHLPSLIQDSFGTHIFRIILLLLAGQAVDENDNQSKTSARNKLTAGAARSKKSALYRAKGAGTAASAGARGKEEAPQGIKVPSIFAKTLKEVKGTCLDHLGESQNELRAIAVSAVSAPTLVVFLQLDGSKTSSRRQGKKKPSSLTADYKLHDVLLGGLVKASTEVDTETLPPRSDFVETMLRDTIGSHVLQAAVSTLPPEALVLFCKVYLSGRVVNLAVHPIAHFVIGEAVRGLGPAVADVAEDHAAAEKAREMLLEVVKEVKSAGSKAVKEGKSALLLALLEAAAVADPSPEEGGGSILAQASDALLSSFWIDIRGADREAPLSCIVPVVLAMKTRKDWLKEQKKQDRASKGRGKAAATTKKKTKGKKKDAFAVEQDSEEDSDDDEQEGGAAEENGHTVEEEPQKSPLEVQATTQGSVLLQHLARTHPVSNEALHESLRRQTSEILLALCTSSVAVHVILAAINSATTTFMQRKTLFDQLLPHMHTLADDRWGSRVADAIWDRADPFTRERIVKQTRAHEAKLLASQYGRFVLRRMNLGLFRKDMDLWKDWAKAQPKPEPLLSLHDEKMAESTSSAQLGGAKRPSASDSPSKIASKGKRKAADEGKDPSDKPSAARSKKPKKDALSSELDSILAKAL